MTTSTGLIGVPCAEQARWSSFASCIAGLDRPEGWARPLFAMGQSVAHNRNRIILEALERGVDYVFFLDDDLEFQSDLLTKLLATGKDAVVALSFYRGDPLKPLWYDQWKADHSASIGFEGLPPIGELLPIKWSTSGAFLIKTDLLRRMRQPWFTLGQHGQAYWNDDFDFCRKLAEVGGQLYGCTAARCGHSTTMTVWPDYDPQTQSWRVVLARGVNVVAALVPQRETVCVSE